jgi:LmbE family N-acetylglucosaminyl deacetylase
VSAPADPAAPKFVVAPEQLGPSESAWAASGRLACIRPMELPDVDQVIVVAPHPDDEVLGCGGILRRLRARGCVVETCAVTDGEAFAGRPTPSAAANIRLIRTEESGIAAARLGLGDHRRVRLGLPDGDVAPHQDRVSEYLSPRVGPGTLVLAPWRHDGHPDHDACGRAAVAAVSDTGAVLLEYLVWAWHWADPEGEDLPWSACRRLTLDRRGTAAKRWATTAFRSQTRPHTSPGGLPVLPPVVLRRFWRPYEVFVT